MSVLRGGVPFKIGFKPNAPDLISFSNLLTTASLSSELKLINFYMFSFYLIFDDILIKNNPYIT